MLKSFPAQPDQNEAVVILHGIGQMRWNMLLIKKFLQKHGYETLNMAYPSLKSDIGTLAGILRNELEATKIWDCAGKVHFVTHSMGGLVTRRYLQQFQSDIPQDRLGRVVMLAPPNGGSEVADLLRNFSPYKWIFGPGGQELTTSAQRRDVSVPYYELGIIAGTNRWPYVLGNLVIRGPHDGRVSVESTKLKGMRDHIALSATHTSIMWTPEVHRQIVHFLKNGQFQRSHAGRLRA